MKFLNKAISIGLLTGAASVAVVKLIDVVYEKISGKYITFTGKDLRHIPEHKEEQ